MSNPDIFEYEYEYETEDGETKSETLEIDLSELEDSIYDFPVGKVDYINELIKDKGITLSKPFDADDLKSLERDINEQFDTSWVDPNDNIDGFMEHEER